MTKKIKAIIAKEDIYWVGSDGREEDLICKKGVTYPIYDHWAGSVYFKNNYDCEHRWYINELEKDFIIEYESGDKSLYTFTQSKPVNPKRPHENWKKAISRSKFLRCIKNLRSPAHDQFSFYNPETKHYYEYIGYYEYNGEPYANKYLSYNFNKVPEYAIGFANNVITKYRRFHNHGGSGIEEFVLKYKDKDNQKLEDQSWRDLVDSAIETHKQSGAYFLGSVNTSTKEEHSPVKSEWTDKHYDFKYKLSQEEIDKGEVHLDVYKVAKVWRTGSKDDSGALWHSLKTIARFGDKNSVEREIKALYEQVKGLARENGVNLKDDN